MTMFHDRDSLARRLEYPQHFAREQKWFESAFPVPGYIPDVDQVNSMEDFKDIIWNRPARELINEYGSTVEEMAVLCSEGLGGWLYSSQLQWLADRANEQGTPALTVCVGMSTPDSLQRLASRHDVPVERLVLLTSVGRVPGQGVQRYKTFVGSPKRPGNHWVLVTLDLTDRPVIMYCDSLGWEVPEDLLQWLAPYTGAFGIENLDKPKVIVMHPPSPSGDQHKCTKKCRNYPLQICSNVCGVIAGVCAVLAATDEPYFRKLTGPKADDGIFLKHPSRYERFLRRVLIRWFMTKDLDVSIMKQHFPHADTDTSNGLNAANNQIQSDHTYNSKDRTTEYSSPKDSQTQSDHTSNSTDRITEYSSPPDSQTQSDHTSNSKDRTTEYSSPKDSQTQSDHTSNSKDRTTEYSSPPDSQTQSDHTSNSTDRTTEYSSPKDSQTQSDHTSNSTDRITEYSSPPDSQTQSDHTSNSKDRTTEYSSPKDSQTQSDHTSNSTDRITECSSPPDSQTQSDHTSNSKDRTTEYSSPKDSQTQSDHTSNSTDRITEYSSPPDSQTQSDHTSNSTDRITEYSFPPDSQTQSDHTSNSTDRITEYSSPPDSQTQKSI
ncbi:uncharacterized protein LOC143276435 [Babylonia areolata]|uniref:uncharacterized protein LOC143276435 n=1 Tax=Babylonia areolata TaxID=304850 RepID=UPI003FD30B8F